MASFLADSGRAAWLNRCAPGWLWTSENGLVATRDSSRKFGELSSRFELTEEEGTRNLRASNTAHLRGPHQVDSITLGLVRGVIGRRRNWAVLCINRKLNHAQLSKNSRMDC